MTLGDAIKQMACESKKVLNEYRQECINSDFDNIKRPNKKTFYAIKMRSYVHNYLIKHIDKQELSIATYYYLRNIPLYETNEYKYCNRDEIKLLEIICSVATTGLISI